MNNKRLEWHSGPTSHGFYRRMIDRENQLLKEKFHDAKM